MENKHINYENDKIPKKSENGENSENIDDKNEIKTDIPKNLVGIVDDIRCQYHVQNKNHQESPDRVKAIRDQLKKEKIYEKLVKIDPNETTKADLELVHTNRYINKVFRTCTNYKNAVLDSADVKVSGTDSLISAKVAVGGVLAATEAVILSNDIRKVFCNVRPPGHHAYSTKASGFCIFNNVAIGAKKALMYDNFDKVLIVDWDLHHGDGTQSIFKNSKNVMYASLHRAAPFYPNNGKSSDTGKHNLIYNFPQSESFTTKDYMDDFYQYLLPQARSFNPDIIFISCGFDGHIDDHYRALQLTYNHYKIMTKEICKLANDVCEGRVVSVLEGGYSLDVLGNCASVHIRELMNNRL